MENEEGAYRFEQDVRRVLLFLHHQPLLSYKIASRNTNSTSNTRDLAMAEEITYICKRTVVSTKPVVAGKYCDLSVLDRVMEESNIRMVFYYPSTGVDIDAGEKTRKLRESVSEMLTHFPIVTGRLVKNDEGKWMIKCNDAGVRMVEARAVGTVEEWLKCVDREKELKLVHWEDMYPNPYFWSPFNFQLTEFEGGGLAVGLSCSHLLCDLTCATALMKAWADTTSAHKMSVPPHFHPLPPRRPCNRNPHHKPYTALIDHYGASIRRPISSPAGSTKYNTIALAFSHQTVRDCMDTTGLKPSPFQAISGLLWVCISKARRERNGLVNMSVCLDMRKVVGLDTGFFGNCMVYNKVESEGLAMADGNLSQAVKAVGDVVEKMNNEGIIDLIEWLQCNQNIDNIKMDGPDLICASLDCIDPYSAIFEGGSEPLRTSYVVDPTYGVGTVLILPSRQSEGPLSRVAMVTLAEEEVKKLCEDDLLSRFSPTILMGVKASQ